MNPVIAADKLGRQALEDVFKSMPFTKRGIAIGITNETPHTWNAMNAYFYSGSPGPNVLPEFVENGEAALYTATKPTGLARGSVGVITFYIPGDKKTLAVMFSVPFDRNLFDNWWNAMVYPKKREADRSMWSELYYNNEPFKGDDGWHEKPIGEGYSVKGIMASVGQCKLHVKICK